MEYMYGDPLQQSKLSQMFCTLMSERIHLLEPQEDKEDTQKYKIGLGCPKVGTQGPQKQSLPGAILDSSIPPDAAAIYSCWEIYRKKQEKNVIFFFFFTVLYTIFFIYYCHKKHYAHTDSLKNIIKPT